ncbi:MAG: protein translocase subunit SecDF [Bacteroidota bacterium]
MKIKGAVKFFTVALVIVSLFQLSFSLVTYRVEQKAKAFANGDLEKERAYIDSVGREVVYNIGIKKYTYLQCKAHELNLGLDLQGGMNVTLELSQDELMRGLANNNPDANFNKAVNMAADASRTSQKDFVTLFGDAYTQVDPNGRLAAIFSNAGNRDKIKLTSSNSEVINYLKEEANLAIERSFKVLRTRIDKFGVTQPNIQKLEGTGRIVIELPGVDNPARVRKLLQGTAKLEFYQTYDNPQAYQFLSLANDELKKSKLPADSTKTATDTAAAKSALADIGGTTTKADSTKANKKDTAANKQMTPEQYQKENPLLGMVTPVIDDKGQLLPNGSWCGIALIRDTAKINAMLAIPAVKAIIPNDLVFAWEYKAIGENGAAVRLHALKRERNGEAAISGEHVIRANRDISQTTGQVEVNMAMDAIGTTEWKNLTKQNIGHSIAIVLDNLVYSSPNVQNEIPNGSSVISGGFSDEEAMDLSNVLKSGKLPATTRIVEEAVVGPTLGAEAISQGLWSMIIGTIVILVFMVLYYNNSGYVADFAVLLNVFFILGVLASMGAALTLPGIAGIVLTIGMAVDANVLINERVKDELHNARNLKNAIADGYAHASSSIIDSNLTTLLAGFVMYAFGTGPVQGFAITLIIGILSSMFTAVLFTRVVTEWWLDKGKEIKYATEKTMRAFKNFHYDWVGNRRKFYIFSGTIILCGFVSMFTKGFTLGVDFRGGYTYIVQLSKPVETPQAQEALAAVFGTSPEIKTFGTNNKVKITTTYRIDDVTPTVGDEVQAKLIEGLNKVDDKAVVLSSAKVGPTVANDVKTGSFWAVLISLVGIGLYILVRFRKWQYTLGAIVALTHDVLMMLTFYSIFDGILPFAMEVDQNFIAAILTIIGFSINDTVVVFDRIREFLAIHKREEDTKSIINNALNDTLNRTIITSLTVFMVTMVLFIFGGEVIRGFTFALLIGIVFGTFSSLAIATPIVVDFDTKKVKK